MSAQLPPLAKLTTGIKTISETNNLKLKNEILTYITVNYGPNSPHPNFFSQQEMNDLKSTNPVVQNNAYSEMSRKILNIIETQRFTSVLGPAYVVGGTADRSTLIYEILSLRNGLVYETSTDPALGPVSKSASDYHYCVAAQATISYKLNFNEFKVLKSSFQRLAVRNDTLRTVVCHVHTVDINGANDVANASATYTLLPNQIQEV